MKTILLVVAVLLLAVPPAMCAEPRFDVPIADSPQKGPENAPVTIIEFIDFQ